MNNIIFSLRTTTISLYDISECLWFSACLYLLSICIYKLYDLLVIKKTSFSLFKILIHSLQTVCIIIILAFFIYILFYI